MSPLPEGNLLLSGGGVKFWEEILSNKTQNKLTKHINYVKINLCIYGYIYLSNRI